MDLSYVESKNDVGKSRPSLRAFVENRPVAPMVREYVSTREMAEEL